MKTLLELIAVSKDYWIDQQKVQALHNVNLAIHEGELLSIIGPSGSGKSTLLHLIGLLDRPNHGKILFQDQNIAELSEKQLAHLRSRRISFVFQDFNLLNDLTIEDNIALPLLIQSGKNHLSPSDQQRLNELLDHLGLTDRRHHRPKQISGGQQQRVAIARALITKPQILLADEPTGNLDQQTGEQIIKLLEHLCRHDGITMIIVTHDHKIAEKADRIVQIDHGQLSLKPHIKQYLG